jgi:FkbM family methyltransferase
MIRRGLLSTAYCIREITKQQFQKNPTDIARVNGYDIFLRPDDVGYGASMMAVIGWYEPETTELFKKILKPGMKVVDVGANIGWFTLLSASLTRGDGVVYAFEPEPTNFELLRRSVFRNHFSNVKLFQKCISDKDGAESLNVANYGQFGSHSIVRQVGDKKIHVTAAKLDTLVAELNIGHIDLLKIDVEGAEQKVMRGAVTLIENSKISNIVMEWNPEEWRDHEELLQWLNSHFEIFEVRLGTPFLIRKLSVRQISELTKAKIASGELYLRNRWM